MKNLKAFRCPYCHRYYHDWNYFQRHKQRHKSVFRKGALSLHKKRKCLKHGKASAPIPTGIFYLLCDDSHKKSQESCSESAKYKCSYCSDCLDNEHSLQIHMNSEHYCMFCRFHLPTEELKAHVNSKHRCKFCKNLYRTSSRSYHHESNHKCKLCGDAWIPNLPNHYASKHRFLFNYHFSGHHCITCKMVFSTECTRNWHHMKWHNADFQHKYVCICTEDCNVEVGTVKDLLDHELQSLHCVLCGEDFTSQEQVKTHWIEREKSGGVPEYNGAIAFTDLESHVRLKHGWEMNSLENQISPLYNNTTCENCNCQLNTGILSQAHIRSKHRCPYCRSTFDCNFSVFQHIELEHSCKICRIHISAEAMKYHLESEHYCSRCQSYYKNLQSHMITQHQCPYCIEHDSFDDYGYATYLKHIQESHMCTYCLNFFPSEVLEHHREYDHRCRFCNQYFSIKDFEIHRVSAHPCPYCSENVAYEKLSAHLELAHKCSYCSEMYNAEQMKLHVAQQHKCTICLCLFSKNELREHIYSRHKCVLCNDLVNYDSYEQHIDSKHRCAYCQLFFQNVSDHIVKCHKCPMCKYMFLEKKYMLAHVNGAHVQDSPCEGMITVLKDILGSQIYHCEDCFRVFDSECKMNFHRLTSSSHKCIDQLECATCETVFETHAKDHTLNKIKRHECMKGHCAFSKTCTLAASDPVQHLTIRSTEYLPKQAVLSVTCKHCQVDFPDIHMLASHRKHNHAWPCPHCHLTFPWFHELKQHQDITYLCTICDKEVSCKEEHMQKEHKSMIAHGDNILPHRCSFCNRRFSNETFMDHFLSNHKCHFCNSYHTTEMLSAHVVSKHLCVSCQRAFEDLFMHMALEHNCWHCNQFFQTKELLIAHVNSVHVCYYCCLNLKGADCSENIDVAVEDSEASYKCSHCHSYFPESLIGCFMNSTSVCAFCVEVLSHFPITPQLAGRCEYRNCRAILAENQHVIHKRMFHKCPDCPKFFSCEKDCRSHVQKQHSLQAAKIDDVYKYKEANPYKNKNVVETSANDKETAQDISLYKVPVQDSCEQTDSNLIHVMPEKVVQANYQKSAIVVLQNQKQSLTNTNPVGNPVQQNPVYQTVIQKPKVNEILQNTVPQFANQQPRIARTIQNTFDQSVHQSLHQQQELNPILQKPLQQSWETLVVKRPAHNYNTRQKSVSQKNTVLQSPEQQSAESVKNELPVVVNGAVQSLEQQSVRQKQRTQPTVTLFKCGGCKRIARTMCQLIRHVQRSHNTGSVATCGSCEAPLISESEIVKHELLTHHCVYCGKLFTLRREMMNHWAVRDSYLMRPYSVTNDGEGTSLQNDDDAQGF